MARLHVVQHISENLMPVSVQMQNKIETTAKLTVTAWYETVG